MPGRSDRPSSRGVEEPGAPPPDEAAAGGNPPVPATGVEEPDAAARDVAAMAADAAEREALAAVPPDLLALRDEMEKSLLATSGQGVGVQDLQGAGIVGVGIGLPSPDDLHLGLLGPGVKPGDAVLNLYTVDALPEGQLSAQVARAAGTRALSSAPLRQVPVGVVDAFAHRMRLRPAPGGISVGHVNVTAGTLGSRAIGLSAPWNNRHLILSNNHVLANSNAGKVGDSIVQQGWHDGGRHPADQVAILAKWVPIAFGGAANYVDCAVGWAWSDRIRGEQMYVSGGSVAYFAIGAVPVMASIGMIVGKSGRTTQLTQGRVTDIAVSVNVNFGGGRVALFRDQMAIRSTRAGDFSAGGDSGSVIWRWDAQRAPVGLLFAGGGGVTFANKIGRVLSALDIRLLA